MIEGALSAYPPSEYPTLHFSVADCSIPLSLPVHDDGEFGIVFSAWFLNYAGSEIELTNMFRVIESQMAKDGRFVGLTTDAHDLNMAVPKPEFYGLDVEVLDVAYIAPDTKKVVGIKARVKVGGGVGKGGFEFDVFQFRKDVYERCAEKAGLQITWRGVVLPEDARGNTGYWAEWLERPTFAMLEARKIAK
jgi:hypothetical protein